MNYLGFNLAITRIVNSFMSERVISDILNGVQSDWHSIETGVSQGSVLGPILYNIYVADMPEAITQDTHSVQFADDQMLIASGDDTEIATENLQGFADTTKSFCQKWKIRINPEKCKLLKISGLKKNQSYRTRRLTKLAAITFDNTPVETVESLKYLISRHLKNRQSMFHACRSLLSKSKKFGKYRHTATFPATNDQCGKGQYQHALSINDP